MAKDETKREMHLDHCNNKSQVLLREKMTVIEVFAGYIDHSLARKDSMIF